MHEDAYSTGPFRGSAVILAPMMAWDQGKQMTQLEVIAVMSPVVIS